MSASTSTKRRKKMAKAKSHRLRSLEDIAKQKVAENLGNVAEGTLDRFSCGQSLSSPEKTQLLYKSNSGDWCELMFSSECDLQSLVEACSTASFGIDDRQVTDRSYRNAYKLNPDQFVTNFELSNTPILAEIVATMVPNSHQIRAELYKLNVYTTGGHFKAHVDTPRPNQMFGSLVVCLPTHFSGGQLVTRCRGHEVTFDWSSPPDNPKRNLSWAAFFSDVEHEVLPVSRGYRLTLTYNLHHQELGLPTEVPAFCNFSNSPFCAELRQALGNPCFLSDGGVLGFASHHAYVFEELKSVEQEKLPVLMKGADRIVCTVAKSLGLSVMVRPFLQGSNFCGLFGGGYLVSKFPEFAERDDAYESEPEFEAMTDTLHIPLHTDKYITWCQEPSTWQPAGVTVRYGNESRSVSVFYQSAVILIGVPRWNDLRKSFVTGGGATRTPTRKKSGRSSGKATKKPALGADGKPGRGQTETSSQVLERLCFHGEMPEIQSSDEDDFWGIDYDDCFW